MFRLSHVHSVLGIVKCQKFASSLNVNTGFAPAVLVIKRDTVFPAGLPD